MSAGKKPTPGPWILRKYGGVGPASHSILTMTLASHEGSAGHADAALIAEAGTVHHETGLTPRRLLVQRNELARLLRITVQLMPTAHPVYDEARIALAKVSGGAA